VELNSFGGGDWFAKNTIDERGEGRWVIVI
jgi:hypothetical protein